jgi:DNA polymerase-3 subunit chi
MEIWFYHLQNQPLARALPTLVEKALERGWRVGIEGGDPAGLKAIDDLLWTYAPDSFLAHGLAGDRDSARYPVVLADDAGNPNGAALRVYVEGAEVGLDPANVPYARAIVLFDGRVEAEVAAARRQWARLKAQGFTLAYWRQDEAGRWARKM